MDFPKPYGLGPGHLPKPPSREDELTYALQAEGPDEFPESYYREIARERLAQDCGQCFSCIGDKPAFEGSWMTIGMTRMIVCSECGSKRCPHSTDHRLSCTGSNEPGQEGSRYA